MNLFVHPTSLCVINLDEVSYVMPMSEDEDDCEEGAVEVTFRNGNTIYLFPSDHDEVRAFFNHIVERVIRK